MLGPVWTLDGSLPQSPLQSRRSQPRFSPAGDGSAGTPLVQGHRLLGASTGEPAPVSPTLTPPPAGSQELPENREERPSETQRV